MLTSNPSLRNKSLRARNKVANVGLLQGDARPVPRYAVTETYGNQDFLSKTKSKTKGPFYNNNFRNVVIHNSIPDALLDLHTSKYKRPHNGCLWKPA